MNKIYAVLMILLPAIALSSFANAQTDSLKHYLEVASTNNPGVKANYKAYQASLQKIPQAGAIPDLQLDMGFYTKPMDIIDGKQIADFTLMQMFPWFGTRKAAQNEAEHLSNVAFEQFRESLNNLYLDVYTQWFLMGSLQQKLKNLDEHKLLLKQLEELAIQKFSTSAYSSGSGDMSSTLRVRLETVELENQVQTVLSELKAEKAKFNALLNRNPDSNIVLPDSIEEIPFILDIQTAMEEISTQNPALLMIDQENKVYKAKAEADRKMSMPMIGLGLQYSLIGKRAGETIPVTHMNGMDMLMPMVSISLPIYRNKYKAQQRESRFWQQSATEKYNDTYNSIRAELVQIKHQLEDALRTVGLLEKQTDLAKTTYRLIISEFATGKSDLNDIIQVQRQLLDYRLRESDAIADYNTKVASAQKLISFNENNIQQR